MKVACIQLSSGENYNKNFKQVIFYINQAIKKKADLIITPETTSIITSDKKKLYKDSYSMNKDPLVKEIKKISKKNKKLAVNTTQTNEKGRKIFQPSLIN